jgi:DNA-binding transcriptional LysR family regulator
VVKKALLDEVGDVEIRLLRIFKAVVECGGFAAAELELNIGRSTVSRHVQALEELLGVTLCRRGRAGFALSADGERVYQGALALLEAIDAFSAGMHDLRASLAGRLSIGVFDKTATNPQAHIDTAIGAFRRAAPEARLDLSVGTIHDIEAGVIGGQLQLGIVPVHRRSESLEYHELFDETMYLYCGRRHPLYGRNHAALAPAELQSQDYAGLAFHSPNMEVSHRLGLRRRASASDQEGIATLLLSGAYIGFLPDHYAEGFVRQGSLQRIARPDCAYRVRFVALLSRTAQPSRTARAFLQCLREAHRGAAPARPQAGAA